MANLTASLGLMLSSRVRSLTDPLSISTESSTVDKLLIVVLSNLVLSISPKFSLFDSPWNTHSTRKQGRVETGALLNSGYQKLAEFEDTGMEIGKECLIGDS